MAQALIEDDWTGEDVTIAQIERELARLRTSRREGASQPNLRTSVMTHIAWAPPEWQHAAEETLAGMAERHPYATCARALLDGLDRDDVGQLRVRRRAPTRRRDRSARVR